MRSLIARGWAPWSTASAAAVAQLMEDESAERSTVKPSSCTRLAPHSPEVVPSQCRPPWGPGNARPHHRTGSLAKCSARISPSCAGIVTGRLPALVLSAPKMSFPSNLEELLLYIDHSLEQVHVVDSKAGEFI
jgi:hypothetical protein